MFYRMMCIALCLLAVCTIPSAQTQGTDMIRVVVYIISPETNNGNPVVAYYVPDAWKIVKVGSTTYGVFPMDGYPNGVCVRVSASKWTR